MWLRAYFLPWPHFSTLFFQSQSIDYADYGRSPSQVWHVEHHMAEILESKNISFSYDLEMWSTHYYLKLESSLSQVSYVC